MEHYILTATIKGVKVDLVHDALSFAEDKLQHNLDKEDTIIVDSLNNIVSNKLCTLISRQEPKDFIAFFFIMKMKALDFDSIYRDAQKKKQCSTILQWSPIKLRAILMP